jgi:guanylate kinase
MNKQLIVLSGPSCVGKTPLLKAVRTFRPDLPMAMPVLYSSRNPRPHEQEGIDYYFRHEDEISGLPTNRFIIGRARSVLQAVDLQQIAQLFERETLIVIEIYPTIGRLFLDHPAVQRWSADFRLRTVFISPADEEEIRGVQLQMKFESPQEATAAIMLPKLISRSQQQGKILTPKEVADLQLRASRAYDEIQMGKAYEEFIVNHDGEDSANWRYQPPMGDAGKTLQRFVKMLSGQDEEI